MGDGSGAPGQSSGPPVFVSSSTPGGGLSGLQLRPSNTRGALIAVLNEPLVSQKHRQRQPLAPAPQPECLRCTTPVRSPREALQQEALQQEALCVK